MDSNRLSFASQSTNSHNVKVIIVRATDNGGDDVMSERIAVLEEKFKSVSNNVSDMKSDLSDFRKEQREDINTLKKDVSDIKVDSAKLPNKLLVRGGVIAAFAVSLFKIYDMAMPLLIETLKNS